MDKEQKVAVKSLKYFEEAEGVVVTHYLGLKTSELTEFEKVNEIGAKFYVAKNSLVKVHLKKHLDIEDILKVQQQ